MKRKQRLSLRFIFAGLAATAVFLTPAASGRTFQAAGEDQVLDAILRIDILEIQATLTYDPAASSVAGHAELIFKMRPGQTRPLFHFDPYTRNEAADVSVWLDGEPIPASLPSGLRILRFPGTTQPSIEIARDITDGGTHLLTVDYRLNVPAANPRFSSNVNDIYGRGNEEVFPTLNSPGELALHRLTFRVAGTTPFRFLGSGLVRRSVRSDIQEWTLDTEREVASYTVMFALLPAADTVYEERTIGGVPVRIMAYADGPSLAQAWIQITPWLPALAARYGPFPMPRGLSIFLVSIGGGMEYYGATISTVSALRHEIHHMYFGCQVIAKTYRDSWWDEAVTSWAVDNAAGILPISNEYRSNMVSGRSPYAVGFDTRAYTDGAKIIETLARLIGGRSAMTGFLADLYRRRSFTPFNTLQFVDFFGEFSGFDMRPDFLNWVYSGQTPIPALAAEEADAAGAAKEIDWTPPENLRRKYGIPDPSAGMLSRRGS